MLLVYFNMLSKVKKFQEFPNQSYFIATSDASVLEVTRTHTHTRANTILNHESMKAYTFLLDDTYSSMKNNNIAYRIKCFSSSCESIPVQKGWSVKTEASDDSMENGCENQLLTFTLDSSNLSWSSSMATPRDMAFKSKS